MKHNSISKVEPKDGMTVLREMFPSACADDLNFVMFSTSGVHGSYRTIEDAEQMVADCIKMMSAAVTFLVIRPRIVEMIYGTCLPLTADDFAFLKKLRKSSGEAMSLISYGFTTR
jgi:hypothetical protein